MKIVIDIPDNVFKRLVAGEVKYGGITARIIFNLVKKGKPLPKGHGRLIDADVLEECKEIMTTISGKGKYAVRMDDIRNIPTVIEADKEE